MRSNGTALTRILCVLALPLLVSCSTEEARVLPWFKTKTTTTPRIGGLADRVSTTRYFVRIHGFWKQVDDVGVGGAAALNPETVFYFYQGEARVIRKGEALSSRICGTTLAGASVPPGAPVVDCVNVMAGPARAVATQIRFRRMSAGGEVLN